MKKAMLGRLTLCLLSCTSVVFGAAPGSTGAKQGVLLQTWSKELDVSAGGAKDTPVTRVVNLLKEMQGTLQKEMDEDESLYDKLACWCNNNRYEKDAAITAATAKLKELKSTIDASTAKSAELVEKIKETEAEVAAAKAALAEATAQRQKEAKEFHAGELESMSNLDALTNAIKVLSEHHEGAFPQLSLSLLSLDSHGKDEDIPWSDEHETHLEHSFDEFMSHSGLSDSASPAADERRVMAADASVDGSRFLQKEEQPTNVAVAVGAWSARDVAVVRRALKSASAFVQQKHGGEFMLSYAPQSGEILGILKQLKDEMEASLSASQKAEKEAAANFNEMRNAKAAEIENGETMAERKEDELADTNNVLAEAKEDLDQTTAVLTEDQKFMVNLKATCSDADGAFQKRKAARMQEIKAVSETIEILTADEARDTMASTYSFIQTASRQQRLDVRRQRAASILRKVAKDMQNPELSMLATTVELDAFTRVKKAIDDMISMLKTQQSDEVKKSDWCKKELQSNDMGTMKATSLKDELDMKIGDLGSNLEKLTDEVTQAKKDIAQLQVELQRASENRKQANQDFQKTISEQVATQEVLKQALEKLATFYDSAFTQVHKAAIHKQTPPVAQMSYEKNAGASGVMSMIEKLIHEAKDLEKDSRQGEQEEQAQYEALVADTNASVKSLQKMIVTKTAEKAEAAKEKIETEGDLKDTEAELAGLAKYNADLHGECDYILDNFDTRQEARQQEIEALQQAKSILSGASSR
jgi:chromosome segregation ATPase